MCTVPCRAHSRTNQLPWPAWLTWYVALVATYKQARGQADPPCQAAPCKQPQDKEKGAHQLHLPTLPTWSTISVTWKL